MKSILEIFTIAYHKEVLKRVVDDGVIFNLIANQIDRKRVLGKMNFHIINDSKFAIENKICLFCGIKKGNKIFDNVMKCKNCGNGLPMKRKTLKISKRGLHD